LRLRNCAQAHAIALTDQFKACSNAESVVFMQHREMKKILRKFEKSTFTNKCLFFVEFVRSLRSVAYFFALDREAAPR
jgi:hypothetical protein